MRIKGMKSFVLTFILSCSAFSAFGRRNVRVEEKLPTYCFDRSFLAQSKEDLQADWSEEEKIIKNLRAKDVKSYRYGTEFNLWNRHFKIEMRRIFYRELLAQNQQLMNEVKKVLKSSPALSFQILGRKNADQKLSWAELISLKRFDAFFKSDDNFIHLLKPSVVSLYFSVKSLEKEMDKHNLEKEKVNVCLYLKQEWSWRTFLKTTIQKAREFKARMSSGHPEDQQSL